MFVLLDEFGIKPWEINDEHEVYPEDLHNIIALKKLKNEAMEHEANRQQTHAALNR